MANNIIKVTPEELQRTAGEFQNLNNQVKSTTDEMISQINALKPVWEGQAAEALYSKISGLQQDMDKIYRMINEHVTDLNEMARTYLTAEQQNEQTSSELLSGILE